MTPTSSRRQPALLSVVHPTELPLGHAYIVAASTYYSNACAVSILREHVEPGRWIIATTAASPPGPRGHPRRRPCSRAPTSAGVVSCHGRLGAGCQRRQSGRPGGWACGSCRPPGLPAEIWFIILQHIGGAAVRHGPEIPGTAGTTGAADPPRIHPCGYSCLACHRRRRSRPPGHSRLGLS